MNPVNVIVGRYEGMDGHEERELTSMKSNSVFTECNLPAGRKTVKTSEFTRKAQ